MPNQPGFDVNAARKAGYSDDEILSHLTQSRNFDVQGALTSGYSKQDIINHLASSPGTLGTPPPAENVISAVHDPSSLGGKIEKAYGDFSNDVKYGTGNTLAGKTLQFLGARPTTAGVSPGVSDFMASPLLGTAKAAQGVGQVMQPGKRVEGAKNVVGGALQAATIPASFVSPLEGNAAAGALGKAGELIPSTERAGANFQQVMSQAKNVAVPITNELSGALSRYQELVDAGGSRSMAVNKLLNRITSPEKTPLTYGEARDFASNISRLSADEFTRLTPVMKRQVGAIRVALNNAVQQAAETVGKGGQYADAMKEFASASKMNDALGGLKDYAVNEFLKKAPWLALGYGTYKATH